MESSGGLRYQNHHLEGLNSSNVESCPLRLTYVTHDARDVMYAMGLHGLTVFYQAQLMTHCYRWGTKKIIAHLKKMGGQTRTTVLEGSDIRVPNVDFSAESISANNVVRGISESRLGGGRGGESSAPKSISFNAQGIRNLLVLDWGMVIADYGVRLRDLTDVLNNMHVGDLIDWMNNNTSKSMPLILYGLQEYAEQLKKADQANAKAMAIVVPKYAPMSEECRVELTKTLEIIRETRKMEEKTNGPK